MPLFEYQCGSCGHRFEYLTRADTVPSCPKCESADLEKQLSVFAVGASRVSPGPKPPADSPCASCGVPGGPGSCGMLH
jgi:putative FmdB family regulatory protein